MGAVNALPAGLLAAWAGVLGLVVGSFLNVVVHRLPRGDRWMRHRRNHRSIHCR